jgi:uncharacterized membrane protein YfcA
MIILLLIILGTLAGVLAGFFGVGGGIIFTPIFFLIFTQHGVENPVIWTIGTSLFCTFIASFSSTLQQSRQNNFYFRQGLKVGVLGAGGVYIGKMIVEAPFYTETVFVSFFAVLLFFVAVMFYRRGSGAIEVENNPEEIGWKKSGVTGGVGGTIAALAGIGGGAVMVPIMNLWYRVGLLRAVSISSSAIVIISLSGWLQFAFFTEGSGAVSPYSLGTVDFGTAFPVIIGAFVGGIFGARLNNMVSDKTVQIGFSVLALVVAGGMVYGLF